MSRSRYTNKCLEILETNQVIKTKPWSLKISGRKDTTITVEGKIQLSQKKYYQLWPIGSCAGKFYGITKILKSSPDSNISNLPLTPIISNVGTASYQLAKYLAQLISSLTWSGYTVNSKKMKRKLKMKRFVKTAAWYYLM